MKRLTCILAIAALAWTANAPVDAAGTWTNIPATIEWIRSANDAQLTTFLGAVANQATQPWITAVEAQMFPEPSDAEKHSLADLLLKLATRIKNDDSAEAVALRQAFVAYRNSIPEEETP